MPARRRRKTCNGNKSPLVNTTFQTPKTFARKQLSFDLDMAEQSQIKQEPSLTNLKQSSGTISDSQPRK